jgi:hypothetical protein
MSWIYGATGEMHFWNEQIKAERRIKKQWNETYGADVGPAREREAAEKAAAEAKDAAHKDYIAKATARPKLGKVSPEWKTMCGPTGSSSPRSAHDSHPPRERHGASRRHPLTLAPDLPLRGT